VHETGVDWLSVAVGSVHGAITGAKRHEHKIAARLNLGHLGRIFERTAIPLVLHGGTGIRKEFILGGIQQGIAKINIATAIRQPYERRMEDSLTAAGQAVYDATRAVIREDLEIENSAPIINRPAGSGQSG